MTCKYNLVLLWFFVQILEFDLKGIALDNSSSLTIIVKDFETIGQNKYVIFFFPVLSTTFNTEVQGKNGTDSCCRETMDATGWFLM